jgi:hypothetical protein
MDRGSIAAAVCRSLGFARMSEEMRSQVEPVIEQMIQQKAFMEQGNQLVIEKE